MITFTLEQSTRLVVVALLVLSMVIATISPALADDSSTGSRDELAGGLPVAQLIADVDDADATDLIQKLDQAQDDGVVELVESGADGHATVVFRYEPSKSDLEQPQYTVSFGWYIYIYLDRGDWIYLGNLGRTAGTAALCGWLFALPGGIACSVASYIIVGYIVKRSAPPSGVCAEFRFSYVGQLNRLRYVPRSC